LHFIDPDQFHTSDIFLKFGSAEQFREAIKQCEINKETGEKQLQSEIQVPMMQQMQST
jgi:hypothetical protein